MTRQEAIKVIRTEMDLYCSKAKYEAFDIAVKALRQPDIIYCKDCDLRHSSEYCECRTDDDFCSDSERKE